MKRFDLLKGTVIAAALIGGLVWALNPDDSETSHGSPAAGNAPRSKGEAPVKGLGNTSDKPGSRPQFITIEGGKFLMGAQSEDPNAPAYDAYANKDESPVRWVTVDAFAIQQDEVKARDYQLCVNAQKCDPITINNPMITVGTEERLGLSVNFVSWTEAVQYCEYIDARLPTEAEWEKAARGTTGLRFPFGDYPLCATNTYINHHQGDEGPSSTKRKMGDPPPKGSPCDQLVSIASTVFQPQELEEVIAMVMGKISDPNMHAICFQMLTMSKEETVAVLKEVKRLNNVTPLTSLMSDGVLLGVTADPNADDNSKDEATKKQKSCELDSPPVTSDTIGNHPLDIKQLAGGMWEWVSDHYADTYNVSLTNNPKGPESGTRRVQRGGGWMSSSPLDFRGATRASLSPDMRMPDVGFRCARSL